MLVSQILETSLLNCETVINNNIKIVDVSKSLNNIGDYQTNIALRYFKDVKSKYNFKKPTEFAELIVSELITSDSNGYFKDIKCSNPGFINFILSDKLIVSLAMSISNPFNEKINTIVDYSSPNIAKEMHVGHLRSTIIGDVISNILQYKGNNVMRVNHIGDWGTQFGMLIEFIIYKGIDINDHNINLSDLHCWYKESRTLFNNNEEFNTNAHKRVVELQSGNKTCLETWKKLCEISESSYNEIYSSLNVSNNLKIMGESFYNSMLDDIVKDLESKGLLIEDDGAKIMFPIKGKPPLIVRKSDGGYGYDTTDLAAIKHRIYNMNANKIIYVTDSGQSLHFQLIFEAARIAGWATNVILKHVDFGVVLGEDGKRIKSRSGESIKLKELIDEADNKFYLENERRLESGNGYFDKSEIKTISKIIGTSAIKYADLRQNRQNNYIFSYDKMLEHKGDTIIYILYSWVRINNLLAKNSHNLEYIDINNNLDRDILLHLASFNDIIYRVCDNLLPNLICEYLYSLGNKVNEYWNQYRVLGSEEQEQRLALLCLIKIYMLKCFDLLGIDALKINKL
jgi:arginyl-tRNA synthetase